MPKKIEWKYIVKTIFLREILVLFGIICISMPYCFAMQMSQPIKVGGARGISVVPYNLLLVNGFSYISLEENHKKGRCVKQGGAVRFGNGEDALWLHYLGKRKIRVGGKDIKNAFSMLDGDIEECSAEIYKISTDNGITLYAISRVADPCCDWMVLGYVGNNTFVKYFDTISIRKQYFGDTAWGTKERRFFYYGNFEHIRGTIPPFEVSGDTIIMNLVVSGRADPYAPITGQFRFKWDDDAQWFGVEQIMY